ncbi:hypothetical protein IAT40_003825 [Kwoniella sp. CBS 6097]
MSSDKTIVQQVNPIKSAWAEGSTAYGLITKCPGLGLARTLAGLRRYGLDFIVLDGEHGNYDESSMYDAYHAIAALGVSPIARCPGMGSEKFMIRTALDAGAYGVMVPLLETKEQVEDVVHRAKYPPLGGRTLGGTFHHQAFHLASSSLSSRGRTLTFEEYTSMANELTLIIVIIETKLALANIDQICRVKGLDAIFIGTWDLASSLGGLSQSSPILQEAVDKIFNAAKKAGIPVIAFAEGQEAKKAVEKGYEGVMVGLDTVLITQAFEKGLKIAGAEARW